MRKRITLECVETLLGAVGSSTGKALEIVKKQESDLKGKAGVKLIKAQEQKEEALEEFNSALQELKDIRNGKLNEADKEELEADGLNKRALECRKVIQAFS